MAGERDGADPFSGWRRPPREVFARRLALNFGLDENLAKCQIGEAVWEDAQRRRTINELMEEFGIKQPAQPGSRMPSQDDENGGFCGELWRRGHLHEQGGGDVDQEGLGRLWNIHKRNWEDAV